MPDNRKFIASALVGDDLDVLNLKSIRGQEVSAWHGHVSFAHWIIWAIRPRVLVELGTHNAVSYGAFCQAVDHIGIDCKAYAVDTWQGDVHAGYYGDEIYDNVARFNETYKEFSTLMRCKFEDALKVFKDGTVDLLHIDGLHTYEAVRQDYETWLPKMSSRGVILFHDTQVFVGDFGVHRLWNELSKKFDHFEFLHSYGLGVLLVGADQPPVLRALCNQDGEEHLLRVRRRAEAFSEKAQRKPVRHKNLALNCRAEQSSFFVTPSATPQGAVNGFKTGYFGFHTALEDTPWWIVELAKKARISSIVVFNRLDAECKNRAASLQIDYSLDGKEWTSLYKHDGSTFGGIDELGPLRVDCDIDTRFIRLMLTERNHLHLDEVEVYGAVALDV